MKLLFGWAAGRCAFPRCATECCIDATAADRGKVIGKIAHIVAHGDKGPRADPTLPLELRDRYENWILLCPTHHDLVDGQPNTFTVADLRKWKEDHERWVRERFAAAMPDITFAELEVVTDALVGGSSREPTSVFALMDPAAKMAKNGLSDAVRWSLTLALGKAREVEEFVEYVEARSPAFPERLTAGFLREYERLRKDGVQGDALFQGLVQFSTRGSTDFTRMSAGVAVLAYLFEKCEVFES